MKIHQVLAHGAANRSQGTCDFSKTPDRVIVIDINNNRGIIGRSPNDVRRLHLPTHPT
jgi:ribosomal protein S3